jgi:hypothetical protein
MWPLYDADCSPAARELLTMGDVAGAISEWRRLADLGSSRARCVLAFLYLFGAPSIASDLDEARRLALSALTGARGYANFVLGCVEMQRRQITEAVKCFAESHKAGFVPATTVLASLLLTGADANAERKMNAANMLRSAMAAGDLPARLTLYRAYASGRLGLSWRLPGVVLGVIALVRYAFAVRYHIFSMSTFHAPLRSKRPLFNEESLVRIQQEGSPTSVPPRLVGLRCAHLIGAVAAAAYLIAGPSFPVLLETASSAATIAWWALLAVVTTSAPALFSDWPGRSCR